MKDQALTAFCAAQHPRLVGLLALPERQRTALVLRFYGGLTVAEVAAELRCPPGTVTSLTSRAISALRDELGVELTTSDETEGASHV